MSFRWDQGIVLGWAAAVCQHRKNYLGMMRCLHPAVCTAAQTIYGATMSDEPTFAEIVITPEMIEAAAEELWDWVLRCGYNDTFSVEVAREPAKDILNAALLAARRSKYPLRTFDGKPLPKPLNAVQRAALLDLAEKRFATAIVSEDG